MRVPFLDLARLHRTLRVDLESALERALDHSAFIGGDAVRDFENSFASAHRRAGAAGCGSGTDALVLALQACGLRMGDEVVVPAMTFFATAEAVILAGGTPIVADVQGESLLLDAESVEAVRSERTVAVIPVHLYGHAVPFDVLQLWRDAGLLVVEDAAQAHLATWEGQHVGAVGHAACFSFYPAKNLGALGDAGALISDDMKLLDDVRMLRNHGRSAKDRHDVVGRASRLDALQAAFLSAKLASLPAWTEARRALAERYRSRSRGSGRRRTRAVATWSGPSSAGRAGAGAESRRCPGTAAGQRHRHGCPLSDTAL